MRDVVQVDLVVDSQCLLGEGVTWDESTQTLLWVDIDGRQLHRMDSSGRHEAQSLVAPISVVIPTRDGRLLAVSGLGVGFLGDDGVVVDLIASLPADGDGHANDGRCDPQGRLWIGTVDRSGKNAAGLFCVDSEGAIVKARDGRALSNGIDWSPDGSKCYHVDSQHRTVEELTLNSDGLPAEVRTLASFDAIPDGLSVDIDGGIWIALWDGGAVVRLTPDGKIDRRIEVPGGWITSCAFGGRDLRTLYITSARTDLDPEIAKTCPSAGSLFACDVGVSGRGYTPFGKIPTT
ncbi:MAG: SMP-30/gluconolactonase/LRE family protein [bacterium]